MVRYDRVWALVDATGKKKSYLSKKMGHADRYLIDARKQNTNIKLNELQILADELGTTVSYLVGDDDNADAKKAPIPEDEGEDSETAELREIWSSADESERRDLLEMARMLKNRRKQNG